jgi:hypothetical protein
MASQHPARDIVRRDYHAIVNYKNDKPAHSPAHPPPNPPAHLPPNPPANPPIDPLLTASLKTFDDALTAKLIPTTVDTNSNIYDDLDNDSHVALATPIQPLESISQAPLRVPWLQAKSQPWSWVYNHFIKTVLDEHYISRRTQKRTQDR